MGNPLALGVVKHYEHDVYEIFGYVALGAASIVVGKIPATTAPGAGPYTRLKGVDKAIGFAGAVVTQPYISTGLYKFTVDEPWMGLLDWDVNLVDQGAVVIPTPVLKANVRANTTSADAGRVPGTDPTVAAQTIELRFRNSATGALTDIAANTGFWMRLVMLRSAIG